MTYDINAIIAQAASESVDLTEASKGGSGYTPPAEGTCIATLIGYIELGRRLKKGFKGAKDTKPRQAKWIFELAGGTNPHTTNDEGVKSAKRITVKTWLPEPGKQPSEKSGFYKLFSALNYDKDPAVKIPAQLLGKHVKVRVEHYEFESNGEKVKMASIGGAQEGFNITAPRIDLTDDSGMPTGEYRVIPAPERISELRLFLWDYANKQMWDDLFIEGEYEAVEAKDGKPARPAKSKNVIQLELREALDWEGSPIQQILAAGGEDLNLDALDEPAQPAGSAAAGDDPLAGML